VSIPTRDEVEELLAEGERLPASSDARKMHDDTDLALFMVLGGRPWHFEDVRRVDLPIRWAHLAMAAGSDTTTMEDLFQQEHKENVNTLRAWPKVWAALKTLGKRSDRITLREIRDACYEADEPVDQLGLPEGYENNACTEFGRVVGIHRYIDEVGPDGMEPVAVLWDGADLKGIDGWHRTTVATQRRWSSINAYVFIRRKS
jgi:hypothetical protein